MIQAVQPKERPVAFFIALIDFHAPEFKTDYVKSQRYWLRDGNTRLAACLKAWKPQGKVDITVLEDCSLTEGL